MLEEIEVELDGLRLAGWRRPGPGPLTLAFHGWLDNAGSFSRLLPHLPELDLVAFDMPGHGGSGWIPRPGCYHFIDGVSWMVRLLRHWQPGLVLGHSLGGAMASLAAVTVPPRALVLLDSLGPLTSPPEQALEQFQKAMDYEARPFRRRYYASYAEALERVRREGHSEAASLALAQRSLVRDAEGYYYRYDPRLKAPSRARLTEAQIHAFLGGLSCPVHVQSYTRGILPKLGYQTRMACLSDGESVELEGGHHLHLEEPAAVAAPIREFVRRRLG